MSASFCDYCRFDECEIDDEECEYSNINYEDRCPKYRRKKRHSHDDDDDDDGLLGLAGGAIIGGLLGGGGFGGFGGGGFGGGGAGGKF